jgi:hypothetical protein
MTGNNNTEGRKMTTNNIPTTIARFSGKCSHCGARIQVGKVIIKTAAGKWIHASCPKDVPPTEEQREIARHDYEPIPMSYTERLAMESDEPDTDRIWYEVDMGIRKLDGGNTERARRVYGN